MYKELLPNGLGKGQFVQIIETDKLKTRVGVLMGILSGIMEHGRLKGIGPEPPVYVVKFDSDFDVFLSQEFKAIP